MHIPDYTPASILQSLVQLGLLFCAVAVLTHTLVQLPANRRRNPSRLPFPPGPKGYPLIGNVFGMPTSQQWRTYAEWARVYGETLIPSMKDNVRSNEMTQIYR